MFTNLIESSSHISELKRRGSFFLFTVVTYALLFVVAGVASIYAYDAHLEDPNTEIITMLNPADLVETPRPAPANHNAAPPRGNANRQNYAERAIAMASVNDPRIAPEKVSAQPNKNLPLPPGIVRITGRDFDPGSVGAVGPKGGGGTEIGGTGTPVIEVGTPPPAPVEKPKPKVLHKRVINSEAISLPKPPYPPIAKQLRIQGMVSVQVLIDETGKVISARAVSGNPSLVVAAQRAALQARFSPTMLGDQAVKVSGVITYNFMLQ